MDVKMHSSRLDDLADAQSSSRWEFLNFKAYGDSEFSIILQYADDTLVIGEGNIQNIWVLMGILRGFELVLD
ncbi:hypothetical protein CR513_54855, partial [Mucuna pruriens]